MGFSSNGENLDIRELKNELNLLQQTRFKEYFEKKAREQESAARSYSNLASQSSNLQYGK